MTMHTGYYGNNTAGGDSSYQNYSSMNNHQSFNNRNSSSGPNAPGMFAGLSVKDWGKKMRQAEQDRNKHDKAFREAEFFWYTQQKNVEADQMRNGGCPPRKGRKRLDEEELELFKNNTGNVGIAFDKYDNIPVERTGNNVDGEIPVINTFSEIFDIFQMPQFAQNNVGLLKYTKPTPVQKYALPAGLCGRDLLCCAQTGSGKTATFILPIVGILDQSKGIENLTTTFQGPAAPRALILAPTRELCSQIYNEAIKFAHKSPFKVVQIYGGVDAKNQLLQLTRGVDIMVATPGRLIDFIERGVVVVNQVQILVLDEADRMLDMGFEPQIRIIVEQCDMPVERQTMMFSATFEKEMQKLASDFLYNYVWVAVGVVGSVTHTITQTFRKVATSNDKPDELVNTINEYYNELANASASKSNTTNSTNNIQNNFHQFNNRIMIFVAKKRTASWLCQHLRKNGIRNCTEIHGDLSQTERERALDMFRTGQCPILCATDVAARGLDIPDINLVICYDAPNEIDTYVHRIGRGGRMGTESRSVMFYVSSLDDPTGGNSNILKDLVELLQNNGDFEIPSFLLEEYSQRFGGNQYGQRGGRRNAPGAFSFGGRDYRQGQYGNYTNRSTFAPREHNNVGHANANHSAHNVPSSTINSHGKGNYHGNSYSQKAASHHSNHYYPPKSSQQAPKLHNDDNDMSTARGASAHSYKM